MTQFASTMEASLAAALKPQMLLAAQENKSTGTRYGAYLATDGNSITAVAGAPTTVAVVPTADSGWLNHALAFSEHKLRWVEQRAITGNTTKQQADLLSSWVPATVANHLFFMEGTNSIKLYVDGGMTESAAVDQAYADLIQYLERARSYGKFQRIFLGTIPPRAAVLARNVSHNKYNEKVRRLCAYDGFYTLFDFWSAIVDPTSLTLSARANWLRADDALHPTPKGARGLGLVAANKINLLGFPENNLLPRTPLVRSMDAAALNINSNPLFIGSDTGTLLGTGTGPVKAGWRAGVTAGTVSSCVCSTVASADGIGNAQRLVVSGANSGSTVAIALNITEALPYQVANDWFRGIAKVAFSGAANVDAIYLRTSAFTNQAWSVDGFAPTVATASVADFDNSDIAVPYWLSGPAVKFAGNLASGSPLSIVVFVRFGANAGAITLDVSRAGLINFGQSITDY